MTSVMKQLGTELAAALEDALPQFNFDCCEGTPTARYVVYPQLERLLVVSRQAPLILVRPLTSELGSAEDDRCQVLVTPEFRIEVIFKLAQYKTPIEDDGLQGPVLYEYGDDEQLDKAIKLIEDIAVFLTDICDTVEVPLLFNEQVLVSQGIFHGSISVRQRYTTDRGLPSD